MNDNRETLWRQFPDEDDTLLRQPTDELLDDPDLAEDPEVDQRSYPETPAGDEAEPGHRLSERLPHREPEDG